MKGKGHTNRDAPFLTNSTQAFTLIELLIVIGIIGVLAAAVVLVLNPAELLNRARDSTRVQDLESINTALNFYEVDGGTTFGLPNTVYISIPNAVADCTGLALPPLTPGWDYACATEENLRKIDSTGWIPVPFDVISQGSPLSRLPTDPINSDTENLYYAYVTGGSWMLTALFQAERHDVAINDGGSMVGVFEIGNDFTLMPPSRDLNLVGYWPFDEGSGFDANDVSGNGNDGTLSGGTTWQTASNCKVNGCLSFDGVSGYVDTSSNIRLDDATVIAWFAINAGESGGAVLATVMGSGEGSKRTIRVDSNSKLAGLTDHSANWPQHDVTGPTVVFDSNWHFGAFTVQDDLLSIYSDGELYATTNDSFNIIADGVVYAGGHPTTPWFLLNGLIDEVRIYNRALSAEEIQAIYTATN